jgi:glucose/arabinose dehydrogenase/plastocyanin
MNKTSCGTLILNLLCFLLALGAAGAARGAAHTIEIINFTFRPAEQTVKPGDTVTWIQKDVIPHTSTSGSNGTPDGIWNSGMLNLEQTFSRTFETPGVFPYYCAPHPSMVGRIIVESNEPSPPQVAITSPSNNTAYPGPTNIVVEATASASGATVTTVEFFAGERLLGSDTESPYSIEASLAAGTHVLTAKATDSNGAAATSAPVTVTVGSGSRIENPFPARIAKSDFTIDLELVADGLVSPLGLAAPDDGSNRLFVYDQVGLVHVITEAGKLEAPLLDVRDRLVVFRNYDERGLLGLASHPNFAQNPLVYTYTSEPTGAEADFSPALNPGSTNNHQSVVAEWRINSANTNQVDLASRREILRIDQPQGNHNGGALRFGPDGYLYISLGDGGSADDEGNGHIQGGNGQELNNVYGTLLRIDVNARTSANGQYGVPSDNPFVGQEGLDEIYAYGFRNPYTFSFDRLTGELYVADVGQNQVEEVNRVFKGGNYGWPIKEGAFFFDGNGTNAGFITRIPVRDVPSNLVDPIAQYDHDDGLAIVGGFVYRGAKIPGLLGRYVAGDWGSFASPTGRLFHLDRSEFKEFRISGQDRPFGLWLKGLGEDAKGELYAFGSTNLGPSGVSGQMFRIVPRMEQLEIASITAHEDDATVAWTNGSGPYLVQSRSRLTDSSWRTFAATAGSSASISTDDAAGFIRLADVSGNSALPFTVHLSGAAERPNPVTTDAMGSGILSLEGNTLHFEIRHSGLSTVASAAHIHGPGRASETAGVQINLAPFNGGGFGTGGVLSGSTPLTSEQKAMLLDGKTYVNIHTANNPGGEIRGQIAPVAFTTTLSGAAERPNSVQTGGGGSGRLFLAGNQLRINVTYSGLSASAQAAHIHGPAGLNEAAGVLVDLLPVHNGPFSSNGSFSGVVTLTPEQLAHLIDGRTYINVHTPNHPGGEIRGQIVPQTAAIPLSAHLTGAAERPNPVETSGSGSGAFTLEGDILSFDIQYGGLGSTAVSAHIHGSARASEAAGVLIDLAPFRGAGFGHSGRLSGSVVLSNQQRALVLQGLTYVNVHTENNRGGEIRGQIATVARHAILSGASERPQSVQTAGRGQGLFLLVGNQLHMNVNYSGLSTTASASHIHGPASTAAAAGVMLDLQPLHSGAFASSGNFAGALQLSPAQLAALLDGLAYVNIHTANNPGGEIRGQIVR